jgi:hypothetical protein
MTLSSLADVVGLVLAFGYTMGSNAFPGTLAAAGRPHREPFSPRGYVHTGRTIHSK